MSWCSFRLQVCDILRACLGLTEALQMSALARSPLVGLKQAGGLVTASVLLSSGEPGQSQERPAHPWFSCFREHVACSWHIAGIPKHSCTRGRIWGWLSTCTVCLDQWLAEFGGRAAGSTDPSSCLAVPPSLERERAKMTGWRVTVAGS